MRKMKLNFMLIAYLLPRFILSVLFCRAFLDLLLIIQRKKWGLSFLPFICLDLTNS